MLKYICFILLNAFVCSHISSFGQSIVRSSINCLGSSISDNGVILRQTIGQSSNTSVFNYDGLVLRQGFQQPLYSKQNSTLVTPVRFTLYPNPAAGKTLLALDGDIASYAIAIYNINGIEVIRLNDQVQMTQWLDLNNLIPGIYIVTITANKKIGSQKLIIKYQ
jgi:hypothetical protein